MLEGRSVVHETLPEQKCQDYSGAWLSPDPDLTQPQLGHRLGLDPAHQLSSYPSPSLIPVLSCRLSQNLDRRQSCVPELD